MPELDPEAAAVNGGVVQRLGDCADCGNDAESPSWHTDEPLWNFVAAGQTKTVMEVRPGAASGKLGIRSEGVPGMLCPQCFTRRAAERGLTLHWKPEII